MKKILYFLIPAVIIILIFSLGGGTDDAYLKEVEATRMDRIRYLQSSKDSPFNLANIPYQDLEFFPIDPAFRITARLERFPTPQRMTISNSDGSTSLYTKYAYAHFKLDGQEHQLLIMKPAGFAPANTFFTAFADATSGETTYGGGRYLDLEIGKSDKVEIDFNLAYNPYCAYVPSYTCPFPPKENILPIAITAGEKDYPHE